MERYHERSAEERIEDDLIHKLGWSQQEADRERSAAREMGYRSFANYLQFKLREKRRQEAEEEEKRRRQRRRTSRARVPGSSSHPCPDCGKPMKWNSEVKRYVCSNCGATSES